MKDQLQPITTFPSEIERSNLEALDTETRLLNSQMLISNQQTTISDLQEQILLFKSVVKSQLEVLNKQTKQIEALQRMNNQQTKEIENLKSEIRRLKELKSKPKLRSSNLDKKDDDSDNPGGGNNGKRAGSYKRSKHDSLIIHKTEILKAKYIPVGSKFKGYREYVVQGIAIRPENTLFKLERWRLPDGNYRIAELPSDIKGYHFSSELRTYILHQHHHQCVTQPLLLSQLQEWGIDISKGQLNRILTEKKEEFHAEKRLILSEGLCCSSYIQVDDTGARHDGRNGYCTHIGNELFAWFESTGSKSRINFLELLRQDQSDYLVNEEALSYMKRQGLAPKYCGILKEGITRFNDTQAWITHLEDLGMKTKRLVRIATEGALIGGLLEHGFRTNLVILSDDAGQFNIFRHALCWVHAERKINELIPYNIVQVKAIEEIRTEFWNIYHKIKDYKKAQSEELKEEIGKRFDKLCATRTCYELLNGVLKRMKRNKAELLLVLDRPEIPLHNNLSENDIREYVKKRKISGSTRSEEGRKCRDTFTSLKKTCKKLGIRFWDYLNDRLSGKNAIASLPILIREKALTMC
jgi:hypothetical protein